MFRRGFREISKAWLMCNVENEASSDEDSKEKVFKKMIEKKANEKKMKLTFKKSEEKQKPKVKQFKEEKGLDMDEAELAACAKAKRVGAKAIRKILRKQNAVDYPKDQMNLMIWEVDEDLDGYVNKQEFERMYKRCITDEKEKEPKKLFFLVQFLMYDKDSKYFITEEDTLELLYIRYKDNFLKVINDIFKFIAKKELISMI